MKKLICLLAAFMILLTACGENNTNDTTGNDAQNGVVTDGDGVIDENNDDNNNIIDDAADGASDVVDGVADGASDVVDGAADATKEVADGAKKRRS